MFSTECIKAFYVAIATGMLGASFAANPARAEDPAVRTPSVMNQINSGYAETLKFYLHPAPLEVTDARREMMDHPAVSIAKTKQAPRDATATMSTSHPAVAVQQRRRAPLAYTAEVTPSAPGIAYAANSAMSTATSNELSPRIAVNGPGGTALRLVHTGDKGWKLSDRYGPRLASASPLQAPTGMIHVLPAEIGSVMVDGTTGYVFAYVGEEGWRFLGTVAATKR